MKKKLNYSLSLFLFAIITLNRQCDSRSTTRLKRGEVKGKSFIIVDETGKPTNELLRLLDETNVKHDGTLAGIIKATQKTQNEGGWLRGQHKERWETEEIFPEKHGKLLDSFDRLYTIQEQVPHCFYYDYVVILGATIQRMRFRVKHLIDLFEKRGIRFGAIVVLVGQRGLDKNLESEEILLDKTNSILPFKHNWRWIGELPTTETEAAKLIFDQSVLPSEWKNISIVFVDTPTPKGKSRPNTQDSIECWLKTRPKGGSILAISSQPFINYQDTVLRCWVPEEFCLETVGSAALPEERLTVLLDNMARWLYQENIKRNLAKNKQEK